MYYARSKFHTDYVMFFPPFTSLNFAPCTEGIPLSNNNGPVNGHTSSAL